MKTDYESILGFVAIIVAVILLLLSLMKSCALRNRTYCEIFHGEDRMRMGDGFVFCPKCGDNFEE